MSKPDEVTVSLVLEEVKKLRREVEELRDDTRGLVQAWTTATGLVKFVKLLSTLLAAIAAVYLFVTHGFKAPG